VSGLIRTIPLLASLVCAFGIWLGRAYPATLEWRDLRFEHDALVSAPGAVVSVEETAWSMPPKKEGYGPLPVYRVSYRYGFDDGRSFDGASYTTGLFHRVKDPVTVETLAADPAVSRAHRTTLAPRGPLGLLSALLPPAGLLVAALVRWKRRDTGRLFDALTVAAPLVALLYGWVGA